MKLKKYLIAGGNYTLIGWNCSEKSKREIIKKYLGKVEQIGFASTTNNETPTLTMMGNEFCGNGTIAFASTLQNKGKLKTSGISKFIEYRNNNDGSTSICIPLQYKIDGNIVLFEGIGYLCLNKEIKIKKKYLQKMSDKYNLPAFGIAICINDKLTPYVYVKSTDSLFKETSCGSGSIATSITNGLKEIIQLSGEKILVEQNKNNFKLTAKVTKA